MMNEVLENALEWFAAPPKRWLAGAKQDLTAAAEWVWEVLQGDFTDEQSTAQIVTSSVVSMIPFVDQICDVRDIVANCRKINEDKANKLAWLALVLTLIGLFPTLGSLVKGCFKIVFGAIRRGVLSGAVKVIDSDLWKVSAPYTEAGIHQLSQHLDSALVRRTLKALKIDNPFKMLATQVRQLRATVNVSALAAAFDDVLKALDGFADFMKRCGSAELNSRVGRLLTLVRNVRNAADRELGQLAKPTQEWLDHLARRLEIEADMKYRAYTNAINPHGFLRPKLDAELDEFAMQKPGWVDATPKLQKRPLDVAPPTPPGWFPLDPPMTSGKSGPLDKAYQTFHNAEPKIYPPGTVLYRIVDPKSSDNSICWMNKTEFDELRNKSEWRRKFAVWRSWNGNGEFVTYTVPPGAGLRGWEGTTASQAIEDKARKISYTVAGGGQQIVLNPDDLIKSSISKRQATGWGYGDSTHHPYLTGVPVLTSNWYGN